MRLLAVLFLTTLPVSLGELIIYPHASEAPKSTKFRVFVSQGTDMRESFVYMTSSTHRAYQSFQAVPNRTASWTSFAFTGVPVTVTVHSQRDFNSCIIRPKRYGYTCKRTGPMQATFLVVWNTTMMSVEFDNNQTSFEKDITDKLLVFADPPEAKVPSKDDPHVLYYDVGTHNLNGQLPIPEGTKEVYLAPGAFVEGGFITASSQPVYIHGRGVLDTRQYVWHDARFHYATITMQEGSNHTLEGITLSDGMQFFIRAISDHVTISNVKTVGAWVYNNDGVTVGYGGVLKDSFIHANDDAIKLYFSNVTVTRCVVWQAQNGAVFQFGWSKTRTVHHVRVSNIDVIHTDWCTFWRCTEINVNDAVMDIGGNTTHYDNADFVFRDVRVEGFCPRVFNMQMVPGTAGLFTNVSFEYWRIESQSTSESGLHNQIAGCGNEGRIEDWYFVDFRVGRKCVLDPSQGNFVIDNRSTNAIVFACPEP